MRKILFCFAVLLSLLFYSGCKGENPSADDGGLKIVATVFPQYDWLRELTAGSGKAELTLLLDKGVDLHSYQPSADDLVKISKADLFVYTGGESDQWVEEALEKVAGKDLKAVSLLGALGDKARIEETAEGMEAHHHHHDHDAEDEDGDDGDHDEEEEEEEYDEHVWLSLKNAVFFCERLRDVLSELDPENRELYHKNASAYVEKLSELDKAYEKAVGQADVKVVLFGDRFPFLYLMKDYGLAYYAAFSGCSAESEASFETVVFLAKKLDELNIKAIVHLESSDGSLAKTIRESTAKKDQKILTMDSLQSASAKSVSDGQTYLKSMEENLKTLKEALK